MLLERSEAPEQSNLLMGWSDLHHFSSRQLPSGSRNCRDQPVPTSVQGFLPGDTRSRRRKRQSDEDVLEVWIGFVRSSPGFEIPGAHCSLPAFELWEMELRPD